MPADSLTALDLLIPSSRCVEYHLARVHRERDLLERLLALSLDYERRAGVPAEPPLGRPSPEEARHAS
jgi:hypothetical protein